MKGKLYGVSVGPGDPELLTLRAVRVLEQADCIAAPTVGSSLRAALGIVGPYIAGKPVLDCATPMTRDRERTARAYDDIAGRLAERLDAGESVAFVTLGDASIYSTWSYVCERMVARGYEVEVVPGVPSFCAAAAMLQEPLCERHEQLLVAPVAAGNPAAALDVPGTKVFMKAGKCLGDLAELLRERGLADRASLVANCGLPGEAVLRGLDGDGELPGYMSVIIVKEGEGEGERRTREASRAMASSPLLGASPASSPDFADSHPDPLAALKAPHPALRDEAARIAGPDEAARTRAVARWNAVAKPIGGLGVLEDDIARIAALVGTEDVRLGKRAVAVFCADNGVVAEGVSQCGQEVTSAVAANIARGTSSVCQMARTAGTDVLAIDMGMATPPAVAGILDRSIARGTGNIAHGPAMSTGQALQAIRAGIGVAADLKARGYDIVAAGEMGIGNTTTSSALASVLLGLPVDEVCGRGAGLSDEGLARKRAAIGRAIRLNAPDPDDALDILAKLGGFDIAGLVGLYLGGAIHRIPVIIDGFIGAVAATVAAQLVPACTCAMLASHVSSEFAAGLLLERLGLRPTIQAGMHLGEGTGAVCLLPLLDAALALYNGTSFADASIPPYDPTLF